MHIIAIVGRVGRDPETRQTDGGKTVTNFTVADNRRYTAGDGEQREETTWFRVSAWGKLGEICGQYLRKGREVAVVGRVRGDENGNPRVWQGQDGEARASFEVTARSVQFLGGQNGGEAHDESAA
jgi:single-strand DNA-binding protein